VTLGWCEFRAAAFGTMIRRLRTDGGLTQEKLAELADLNLSYIGFLERRENVPTLTIVLDLAEALGVDAGDLVREIAQERWLAPICDECGLCSSPEGYERAPCLRPLITDAAVRRPPYGPRTRVFPITSDWRRVGGGNVRLRDCSRPNGQGAHLTGRHNAPCPLTHANQKARGAFSTGPSDGARSGAAPSCAAQRQFVPFYVFWSLGTLPTDARCTCVACLWQSRGAEVAAAPSCRLAEFFRDACESWLQYACRPRPEVGKHGVLAGTAA